MTDYWDYLLNGLQRTFMPSQYGQKFYDSIFDNVHGSSRYWLSKVPWFSTVRNWEDEAREAQDRWDNTHTDEQYFNRVIGNGGSLLNGDVGRGVTQAVKMARSLSSMYLPEVVENLSTSDNAMFG